MDDKELEGKWLLDLPHSEAGFTVKFAGISKICGTFSEIEATVEYADSIATVEAVITADSFDSGNALRDTHIKSPDFLDVNTYPEITFRGTFDGASTLMGELTAHGISKSVAFEVTVFGEALDSSGANRLGVEASTIINRKDFDLIWSTAMESGEMILSDNVTINLDLSFIRE